METGEDPAGEVILGPSVLANSQTSESSLSNVQREYASEDRPASQVPYTLKGSEHSSQGQQKSIKPKLRDPYNSQDGKEQPQNPKVRDPCNGLRASQANGVNHPPKIKERGESLGNKDLQFSPGKEQILLESNFRRRMKHFLQCVNPHKKGKGTETVLQKGKPVSLTAPGQQPVKGRSGDPEAEVTGTVTGQHLGEQLGLRQDLQPSELNQHTQQLQPPAGGQSNHQKVCAFLEQKRLLRNRVHGHQTTPKDHSSLNSGGTKDKGSKWTSPPKDLETPGRPHQQGPTVAGTSGHLHHHPTCSLQKCASAGQPGCAPQAFPGRKIQSMLRKPVSPSLAHPLCANGLFLP
uniref:Uncharacterized protein n=1 Tax=Sus scrofa TaxID=9823 RepID=A0A8D1A4N2_PIG